MQYLFQLCLCWKLRKLGSYDEIDFKQRIEDDKQDLCLYLYRSYNAV